ncbi:hypothetical protein CGCF413_v006914 [Colletotrichum fructicola]|nr:hypothetical protein CGCF413_v006914 [Colletotrichum fructicola]
MGEHSSSHGLHRMRRPLWRSKDRRRSPSPQRCEELIRKKVPSFSDAPPGQLQYNNSKDRFQARNKVAVKDLGKIIDAHDNEADAAFKAGSSSWDLVFEQMAAAKTRNEERSDLGSKVTAGGDVISAYINLLPDDYGIGILKGGLALIFDATKAHDENRNKIAETFETVPDSILTINMAFDLLDPDPADMKVQTEAVSMLLEDLPALIKILLGEEKYMDIRALLAESKAMQTAIFHNTKKDYASILSEIYRGNEIAAYVASLMKEQMEGMTRERESFSREREHYQARELRLEERNQHLSVENETLRRKVSQNSIVEQPRVSLIDDVQLLDILGVDLDKLGDDSETILGHSEHSDTDERAKAQWLLRTDEFRNWLRENRSSLLLVDGELQDSFISPLSGICGGLISALVESPGSAVAFFFAGLHVDMQLPDIDSGPVAMIRSLIAQLLMSDNLPSRDLSFMSKDMMKGCREGDCLVLCEVFVKIIKQVPTQTTVYCIIDGVSWYEQGRWLDDLDEFATALECVAKRNNAGRSGSLKVLLTSPTQSTEIGHLARKHRNVWWYVSLAAGHIHPDLGFMDSNSLPM